MKHFIRILIGIIIIAGICYGLNMFRQTQTHEPEPEIIRPVRTVTLRGGRDSMKRHYFGTVQGGKRADLSFRVSGTLRRMNVENGSSVKKGALLASLDPRDFNTRISQAQSALSQAEAQYKNAQADFTRYENLYKQKVIARAQYDTYKTQVDVAKSSVNSANANLKAARDALRDTELRAPFDGVIADRKVENFQDITAKQTIFTLQDLSTLEIVFNIPDNDILLAPVKARNLSELRNSEGLFTMNARFDAMPDKIFPLTLKEIATQPTSTNTYPVTAIMNNEKNNIRILPGMAVTVEVDFSGGNDESKSDVKYYVPSTAILNQDGKNFVWRYDNGSVSKLPVNVGMIHNDSSVEIESSNLHNGDVIVTAGVYFLHEGQNVRLMEE